MHIREWIHGVCAHKRTDTCGICTKENGYVECMYMRERIKVVYANERMWCITYENEYMQHMHIREWICGVYAHNRMDTRSACTKNGYTLYMYVTGGIHGV